VWSGSDFAKEPAFRVQSRPRRYASFPDVFPGRVSGVEDELSVDGVGNLALEGAQRLALGLALGHLALEVGPALGVGLADLADPNGSTNSQCPSAFSD